MDTETQSPQSQSSDAKRSGTAVVGFTWVVAVAVWSYVLGVLLVWGVIAWGGDHWWPATILLFAPRGIYALPLVLLVPLAIALRPRWLLGLFAGAAVVLWPIADLHFSMLAGSPPDQPQVRVLSCNVREWESGAAEALATVVRELQPDIVAIQEHVGQMPPIWPPNWNVHVSDGLIIASPHPVSGPALARGMLADHADSLSCIVTTRLGDIRFCNLHLETPRPGLEAVLDSRTGLNLGGRHAVRELMTYRREQSRQAAEFARDRVRAGIVAGDFNMPVESAIYREFWRGYRNAFHWAGWGYGYSKWSEKRGFSYGLRIDHILCSDRFRPVRCWLGPDIGSDHLPLVADLVPSDRASYPNAVYELPFRCIAAHELGLDEPLEPPQTFETQSDPSAKLFVNFLILAIGALINLSTLIDLDVAAFFKPGYLRIAHDRQGILRMIG
jgi:endonuclease/exonuclease/phosphatase (EEP) superfamily protein YafD